MLKFLRLWREVVFIILQQYKSALEGRVDVWTRGSGRCGWQWNEVDWWLEML